MNKLLILFLIIQFLITNLFAITDLKETSYINTKNISYNENLGVVELGKDSLIDINNVTILANKGVIDYKNNTVEIFGNYYLYQNTNILSGYNLSSDAKFINFNSTNISFIYNDNLKVDAFKIEKNKDLIFFYDNFLTPCKINGYFNCPTWSLKINKTRYEIAEDKFTHYDSFLQIADKKLFYLPYFTHYGAKAPRKQGFLTPTLELNLIGAGTSILLPYYIPINSSSDLEITPKITTLPSELKIADDYRVDTKFNKILSGGLLKLDMTLVKSNNESSIYNSVKVNTKQVISKKNTLEFNSLITNSLSNSRSINEDQINYENAYLKLNSYNLYSNNDLLVSEINTVTAFDNADNGLVPYQIPNITYKNMIKINNNHYVSNNLNYYFLTRDKEDTNYANEVTNLSLDNTIMNYYYLDNRSKINNKIKLYNSFKNIKYKSNQNKDEMFHEFNLKYSSEFRYYNKLFKPRIKLILVEDFNSDKSFNEDASSITFNYINLFNDNRFFGNDILDKGNRLAYGIEFEKKTLNNTLDFKVGQSYDFKINNEYLKKINQFENFSDYVFEAKVKNDKFSIKIDSRVDNKSYSKKEMNYGIKLEKFHTNLVYNETSSQAFSNNSDNSKSLKISFSNKINDYISLIAGTNLDLKNENKPYETNLKLKISDDCSELDISYNSSKYSDNFNTSPTETISLTYRMDYLGFFGYEQNANLFFKEQGNFNYGISKN